MTEILGHSISHNRRYINITPKNHGRKYNPVSLTSPSSPSPSSTSTHLIPVTTSHRFRQHIVHQLQKRRAETAEIAETTTLPANDLKKNDQRFVMSVEITHNGTCIILHHLHRPSMFLAALKI